MNHRELGASVSHLLGLNLDHVPELVGHCRGPAHPCSWGQYVLSGRQYGVSVDFGLAKAMRGPDFSSQRGCFSSLVGTAAATGSTALWMCLAVPQTLGDIISLNPPNTPVDNSLPFSHHFKHEKKEVCQCKHFAPNYTTLKTTVKP